MKARRTRAAVLAAEDRRARKVAYQVALTAAPASCLDESASRQLAQERAEHARTRDRLMLLQHRHAHLLAVARAAVADDRDHAQDPVIHLRALLTRTGQMPAEGRHARELLAATRETVEMAGLDMKPRVARS